MHGEIGGRVAQRINDVRPGEPQKAIAELVGITPDAFSRALSGQRAFSSIELARIADVLESDIHWLITGEPDPQRLVVAARHNFDFETGRRDVPGKAEDEKILADVGLAYQQAYQGSTSGQTPLPETPEAIRTILGLPFVRDFADRLETTLGVEIVRVAGLSTSYSFSVAGHRVIVIAATGNWFRENWSIAHELGHLAGQHHADQSTPVDEHEATANAFAADLLLPASEMRQMDWLSIDAAELAKRVWETGVSTDALARRLASLAIPTSTLTAVWGGQPTQRLLRRHWSCTESGPDPITRRMDEAAARRFPLSLQDEHLAMIASGALGKGTLAWMLGIDASDLEIDAPTPAEVVGADDLAVALGLQ